jgi:hypothetical protein
MTTTVSEFTELLDEDAMQIVRLAAGVGGRHHDVTFSGLLISLLFRFDIGCRRQLGDRIAKAALRWDFPHPLGPNSKIVPPRSIHPSPVASATTWARLSMGTAVKPKLSSVSAMVGSRSSRSSNGSRAMSTLIVSLALSLMLRPPSTGEAHRNWRLLED